MNIPDLQQCNKRESDLERVGQAPHGSHHRVPSHSLSTHKVSQSFDTGGKKLLQNSWTVNSPSPPSSTVVRERVISLQIVTLSEEQQKTEIRGSGGRIEMGLSRSVASLLGHYEDFILL